MNFLDKLITSSKTQWDEYIFHPFVNQLEQGVLDIKKFQYYLIQDYYFLIEYGKTYGLLLSKLDNIDDMKFVADLTNGLLNNEIDLHIEFCKKWDIDIKNEKFDIDQNCKKYTDYVMDICNNKTPLEAMVALLPCMVGYAYIGKNLKSIDPNNPYIEWAKMYSDDDFFSYAQLFVNIVERNFKNSNIEFEKINEIFKTACELEKDFWDMCYK